MTSARCLVVAILVELGCGQPLTPVPLEPTETVVGRAYEADRVRLLTSSSRLLTVNMADRSVLSQNLTGLTSDHPWGLAMATDGRLWTLDGTSHVAQLDEGGRVVERRALPGHTVGLFSLGGAVLVQPATFVPGETAVKQLNLDTMTLRQAGSLRSVSFETRAELLTRNLVGCGSSQVHELPCWFSQGTHVDRVSDTGGRQQGLGELGVGWLPPELEGQIGTPGPIVDAHIDATERSGCWCVAGSNAEAVSTRSHAIHRMVDWWIPAWWETDRA